MGMLGLGKQMSTMHKAYKSNPKGFYKYQLIQLLDICFDTGKMTKEETLEFVKNWKEGKVTYDKIVSDLQRTKQKQ